MTVVVGRLVATTGATVDPEPVGADTLTPLQAARPAACSAATVGGVASAAVTLASVDVVAATANDTATDVASRWRPATATSVTPVTMTDTGGTCRDAAIAELNAVA